MPDLEVEVNNSTQRKTVNEIAMEGLIKALDENAGNPFAREEILEQIGNITSSERGPGSSMMHRVTPNWDFWCYAVFGGAVGGHQIGSLV